VQHDRTPQGEARGGARHIARAPGAELFIEQRLHVPSENATRCQFVPIARFGQERFSPELLGSALDGLLKRLGLERVQRIVVDEDTDGTLSRQQQRGLIDYARDRIVRHAGVSKARTVLHHDDSLPESPLAGGGSPGSLLAFILIFEYCNSVGLLPQRARARTTDAEG
jgi:hypothetical protein